MPSSLIKSAPTQVNYSGGTTRMFSIATGAAATSGNTATPSLQTVPDGSGESLVSVRNAVADTANGVTATFETRLYTGRFALAIYLDDFYTDSGFTTIASSNTAFNQLQCTIAISNDSITYNDTSHLYQVVLTRGWNVIPLSRAYAANVARNAGATAIRPQLSGTGTVGIPSGTAVDGVPAVGAAFTSSLYDAVRTGAQLRITVASAGASLFSRFFVKEIVDNYQADSKTCLIFDDARDTVYTDAFPLMRARGLVGTLPIISSSVGTPGFMTVAQISELYDAGWDIVNHTRSHLPVATMAGFTQAQCFAEIDACEQFIKSNGWIRNNAPKYFVSPFGGMQQMNCTNYRAAITQAGCVASFGTTNRAIGGQLISPFFIPRIDFNTMGPTGAFTTGTGYNIATMVDQYTQACMNGASPMVMLHQFLNVPTDSTMLATTELETFLDRVVSLRQAGFTSVEPVTTAIPALTTGSGTGIRHLK
jgi:hypothetical protein